MLIRFDFIGVQNGEDVSGYKFASSTKDVEAWLAEQHVTEYFMVMRGLFLIPIFFPLK